IRAAEAHLVAAHAEIEVARAEMFPQVVLTAKFGFVAEAVRGLVIEGSSVAGAGPAISYSIFDGGRLSAQSDASKRKYDLLLAEYRKSIYAGLADVEKSLLNYQQAVVDGSRWSSARDLQSAQRQRLDQSLAAGRASRLELIAAQEQALDVDLAAVRSYRAQLDSLVGLYQALGGGWDPRQLTLPEDAPKEKQGDAPVIAPAATP
ncbi:MAG TPA: TolC family protein, partial [Nevskia sp.]|nr:TolC family protein [Nevskia sp.]